MKRRHIELFYAVLGIYIYLITREHYIDNLYNVRGKKRAIRKQ
jgi:hypothetical protein